MLRLPAIAGGRQGKIGGIVKHFQASHMGVSMQATRGIVV